MDITSTKKLPFVRKLVEILMNPNFKDIVRWSNDGSFIIVNRVMDFETVVLPLYFDSNRMDSFSRQLNIYGFKRISDSRKQKSGPAERTCAFKNSNFLRDRPDLLVNIVRQKAVRQRSQPSLPNLPPSSSSSLTFQDTVPPPTNNLSIKSDSLSPALTPSPTNHISVSPPAHLINLVPQPLQLPNHHHSAAPEYSTVPPCPYPTPHDGSTLNNSTNNQVPPHYYNQADWNLMLLEQQRQQQQQALSDAHSMGALLFPHHHLPMLNGGGSYPNPITPYTAPPPNYNLHYHQPYYNMKLTCPNEVFQGNQYYTTEGYFQ